MGLCNANSWHTLVDYYRDSEIISDRTLFALLIKCSHEEAGFRVTEEAIAQGLSVISSSPSIISSKARCKTKMYFSTMAIVGTIETLSSGLAIGLQIFSINSFEGGVLEMKLLPYNSALWTILVGQP